MKKTGAVVQVDVSSVAECDLPSLTSFHYSPPNKEPDIRCASTEYRALGLKPLATHDPNKTVQLNFVDYFRGPIPFQRHDDLPLASPAF
jgi:hypothetical protein